MPGTIKLTQQSNHKEAPKWSMGGRQSDEDRKAARRMPRSESCPGPGRYGVPPNKASSTMRSSPTFSFGSGKKDISRTTYPNGKPKDGFYPGPGNYGAPLGPYSSASYGFGTADRLGLSSGQSHKPRIDKSKDYPVPGPGNYMMKSTLEDRNVSFAAKRDSGKDNRRVEGPGPYPGPGAHKPGYSQVWFSDPMFSQGTGNRLGIDSGLSHKSRLPKKPEDEDKPGPGTYSALPELGGNAVVKSSPAYSFRSRQKPVKSDATPGHYGDYSQFMY
eukprot:gnl/TRDRNA2_/TRDRNA2_37319_c0_seq1.p1 gnl/TRDRNA2_/TRDRNA2_37319_c0~~gnl/TRDRNA2_/TRDRNA2_37319_c0_seq1.p1  ORF type:complete len:273 (-),score=22.45 gnl/TRDRNA2_/TRDRNA2_37319_c0_seq1:100-918(-)